MTDVSSIVNVLQTQNTILTSILNALNTIHTATVALAPTSLTGSGPQTTQQITGNGQTISVGANGSTVLTTTTGANMTGMILGGGSLAGQRFTVINTTAFSITFTSSVAGTPTQAASVAQTYIWDGTNLNWRQVV